MRLPCGRELRSACDPRRVARAAAPRRRRRAACVVSSREFFGRGAACGYAELGMGAIASGATRSASPARARELDDVLRVAVPARLARGDGVVGARRARASPWRRAQACAVTSASRSAPVGAPIWSSITVSESRSRARRSIVLAKLSPRARVDPAGAKDQVPAAARADQLLAFELGAAVDAERAGRRPLGPRRAAAAVEHVVGAVVDEPGAARRGLAREHAEAPSALMARASSGSASALSTAVWAAALTISCGAAAPTSVAQRVRVEKVEPPGRGAVDVERDQLAQRRQRALQLPADLAVLAEQQDLHAERCS